MTNSRKASPNIQSSLLENVVSDGAAETAARANVDESISIDVTPPRSGKRSAQELVAFFVDAARRQNGESPPRRVIGTISKEIGVLLKEGQRPDVIEYALELVIRKGLDPTSLASAVFTAQTRMRGMSADDARNLDAFLAEIAESHRLVWPTGNRWVRGAAAGTYVEDALGCDKPDYSTGFGRPSREEVLRALHERRNR